MIEWLGHTGDGEGEIEIDSCSRVVYKVVKGDRKMIDIINSNKARRQKRVREPKTA